MYKNRKKNYPLYEVRAISSLRELVDSGAEIYGDKPAFKYKKDSEVVSVTYKDFKGYTDSLGTALVDMGLDGKHIAIIGENCYNWVLSYFTLLNTRGVVVPVDKELSEEEVEFVITSGECSAVIYSGGRIAEKINNIREKLTQVTHYIAMDEKGKEEDFVLEELLEKGKELLEKGDDRYITIEPDNECLKELLFTSGTTGRSKGVMINAKALIFNIINSQRTTCITDTCLSVLPYHHSYESTTGLLTMFHNGMTICINESLRAFMPNMKLYKPTEIQLVPLFVEKIYQNIWDKVRDAGKEEALKKLIKFSDGMLKVGIDMRKKLFSNITEAFGGRLIAFVCGGAPIKPQISKFFSSIGIALINGYGITECAPLISINRPNYHDHNSVGVLLPDMELKIDNPNENGEGEICVKGPNVMMGYYKNPEATAEAIVDGWFHTGDIGKTEGDFIYITGRIKNIIILKNGKNIYPEEIEEKISELSNLVSEILVKAMKDGENEERLLGVEIFPDYARAEKMGITDVEKEIKDIVSLYNSKAASYKKVNKVVVRTEEFEKTTSKKIKRKYN